MNKLFFKGRNTSRKFFITLVLLMLIGRLVIPFMAFAQESPKFNLKIKLVIKDGDLKNALITITKNGKTYCEGKRCLIPPS